MKLPARLRLPKAVRPSDDYVLLFQEMGHFPKTIALAILFPLLASIFEGFGIGFLLGFLQNLINPGGVTLRSGIEWIDTSILGVNQSELNRLFRMSALILLSTWIRVCFSYLATVYMRRAEMRLVNRLYKKIYEQIQSLSLQFYNQARSGEILNTITAEVAQVQQMVRAFGLIVTKGSVILVYTVVAIWISLPLTLSAVALFSLVAIVISNLTGNIRAASVVVSKTRGRVTARVTEILSGIRTIQLFATQDFERQRFYRAADDYVQAADRVAARAALVVPLAEAIATTILTAMIVVGVAIFVENGLMQVSALLTFLFVLFRTVPAIQEINAASTNLNALKGAISNIEEFLRSDNKPYLDNGYRRFTGLMRGIEVVDLSFGYTPNKPVLNCISLSVGKGETVALVGASGAGKSTLADLIPRLYDPWQGQILLDGVDLRTFDITSVRRYIAVVSQDTFIFNSSVRDNIAYGSQGCSDEEIITAAQLANADEFIQNLPEKLDTVLGDRGVKLSGGQRQRIAIARALLLNPEILILDEATSALDSISEKLVQDSIDRLSLGRTVITIAHRLSTIKGADRIVVLENGYVVEEGTYEELLTCHGKLYEYHQAQFSPEGTP